VRQDPISEDYVEELVQEGFMMSKQIKGLRGEAKGKR
jgi:hypothetical protein